MERWIPLFDIFLNSSTPETEASIWLNQSFSASSPSSPITTASFLSLLTKPINASITSSSPPATKRIMFIQTLPDMVQSRILSFLAFEHERFCKRKLSRLATNILTDNLGIDFWVKRAAHDVLDQISESNYEWISGFSLDSGEERVDDGEFESLPDWLKDTVNTDLVLPWLPVALDDLNSRELFGTHESEGDPLSQVGECAGDTLEEVMEEMEIDSPPNAPLAPEIQDMAASLRIQVVIFESCSRTVELANVIRKLCLDKGVNSFAVLGLVEPWKADDEIASVLLPHLLNGIDHKELDWPSQVLSSVILPKMLILEEPASRMLVAATIDYCKLHQAAAEYALLFPLIMRTGGINNSLCDVMTRIIKECLHPVHVSSFCQKLLCGGASKKRFICLPCHQCLISNELVWTESLFNLFHNILNLNIQLTQDLVDQLALRVQELAQMFSKSLKFGNFLLCFITKCSLLLMSHKLLLTKAAEQTNTFVTKSILSKLASF
ncbi:uncharacterized protein LOC8265072 [Ricinus communis]|uniref:Uncharacterized protein n=1 Tax=Ricinus communis TaxID=3988 RepID=B9RK99_RICCO|nr:uncharacterized protein LOC8265072 [Ricinus communis]EEF48097.1 conserved hypothetical protein [Ricinus communis]|eukprot:XP_002514143.1 uncharacterized protein LOC8265072 [Ricinus communis]